MMQECFDNSKCFYSLTTKIFFFLHFRRFCHSLYFYILCNIANYRSIHKYFIHFTVNVLTSMKLRSEKGQGAPEGAETCMREHTVSQFSKKSRVKYRRK